MDKYLITAIVILSLACCILYAMHCKDEEENKQLKTALAAQSALLAETQAELALRDTVIAKRDAELAEMERKSEAQERAYAKLKRENKEVRDWADTLLPADVRGLLKNGKRGAADTSGGTVGGSGNP